MTNEFFEKIHYLKLLEMMLENQQSVENTTVKQANELHDKILKDLTSDETIKTIDELNKNYTKNISQKEISSSRKIQLLHLCNILLRNTLYLVSVEDIVNGNIDTLNKNSKINKIKQLKINLVQDLTSEYSMQEVATDLDKIYSIK